MKFIALLFLVLALPALSQTMEAQRKKDEMIQRAQDLRLAAENAEEMFDNVQVNEACSYVDELFRGLPAHLTGIMSSMNIYDKKVKKMSQEALALLKDSHALETRCKRGENHQYVDPSKAKKQMKEAAKTLKKHKGVIEDKETDYNNAYYYHYDFNDPY
ncbi:MAG: hypothetical protein K2P81_07180 [Bacteriovoracaceae bacterium]|nr:hypothetical protein [Bacteriovoracaceae bacterium]